MIKKSIGFCLGMLVTAIPLVWVIVYVFHDVDAEQTGKLDLAFRQLTDEALFFILLTSTVFVTVSLLRRFKSSPQDAGKNQIISFWLGVGQIIFQYLLSFAARKVFQSPQLFNGVLWVMLLISPAICAIISTMDRVKTEPLKREDV
jgi:hypothetical protein